MKNKYQHFPTGLQSWSSANVVFPHLVISRRGHSSQISDTKESTTRLLQGKGKGTTELRVHHNSYSETKGTSVQTNDDYHKQI